MMDCLWCAASRNNPLSYQVIGDCYLAVLKPIGAFDGVSPEDSIHRPWSEEAKNVMDDDKALQSALRAYFEGARLGDRGALLQFSQMSRYSNKKNQHLGLDLFNKLESLSAMEIYQCGLVQYWLGEFGLSAQSHLRAANMGNTDAQFELYIYFSRGIGVEINPEMSQHWLQRAAEANHPRALYNIGAAYASGSNVKQDFKKAAYYYARAAQLGNGQAAAMLAVMILMGQLEGSKEKAINWLDLADEFNYPTWELLDTVGINDPREA
ncbi:tetratricopeptide repeat protein [Pseudobacteroides cellulosolvens]|nr:tetratricopeptide repeat protein [Pseudobacteroides cellulosolvens]